MIVDSGADGDRRRDRGPLGLLRIGRGGLPDVGAAWLEVSISGGQSLGRPRGDRTRSSRRSRSRSSRSRPDTVGGPHRPPPLWRGSGGRSLNFGDCFAYALSVEPRASAHGDDRADRAGSAGRAHQVSIRATAAASRPCSRTRARRKRYAAIPAAPCIQPGAGRQERVVVAVLDEAPVDVVAVADRAVDDRVGERDREGEVLVVPVPLPDVEHHVADARRTAAATVVVPEAGVPALGDARDLERVQARALPVVRRAAGHRGHPGAVEGGEQQRRAGRSVAPGVGEGVETLLAGDPVRRAAGRRRWCRRGRGGARRRAVAASTRSGRSERDAGRGERARRCRPGRATSSASARRPASRKRSGTNGQ